jgi:hypothetical protein
METNLALAPWDWVAELNYLKPRCQFWSNFRSLYSNSEQRINVYNIGNNGGSYFDQCKYDLNYAISSTETEQK